MIGRGIIKSDDYLKFGKVVDELVKVGCYSVMYVPKTDMLCITCHRDKAGIINEKFNVVEVKVRGGLAFIKIKWRV